MLSNLSGMKKFYNRIEIPISTCYKGGYQITRDISAERAGASTPPSINTVFVMHFSYSWIRFIGPNKIWTSQNGYERAGKSNMDCCAPDSVRSAGGDGQLRRAPAAPISNAAIYLFNNTLSLTTHLKPIFTTPQTIASCWLMWQRSHKVCVTPAVICRYL